MLKWIICALISLASVAALACQGVSKIDWTNPQNRSGLAYRSTFDAALAQHKSRGGQLLGNRFVIITPGCGNECQVIGLLNVETGIARMTGINSMVGARPSEDGTRLVVNPPEVIREVYGAQGPSYLQTKIYILNADGYLTAESK